jgi:hypothetical protein
MMVPILLGLIMAGGLLLRLIFFTASAPLGGTPLLLDEGNYLGIAESLYRGEGFREGTPWLRPPGYPLFLATILGFSGGSRPAALFIQALLSVANIAVAYALGREAFARRHDVSPARPKAIGLASAGLMAANPFVASQASMFMAETLYMLLLSLLFWAMLRAASAWEALPQLARSRKAIGLIALAGLLAAAGALTRSQLLGLVPLLLAWLWWALSRKVRWRSIRPLLPIAIFLGVMLAAILPWTVRNYVRYQRFLLVETTGGYNFWLYNDVIGRDEINQRLMEIRNPVDREAYATRHALAAITSDPLSFVANASQRFTDAWPVEEFSQLRFAIRDKYPGTDCTLLDLYAWAETIFYVGFGLFTLWGFALAPGRALKGLFLLALLHYALVSALTITAFRFRMSLYPLAGVFAAWALVGLVSWLLRLTKRDATITHYALRVTHYRFPRWSFVVAGLLSLLFVAQSSMAALPGMADSLRYERRYLSGKSLMSQGDYAGALANFTGAAEIDHSCACLYRLIGQAHGKLEQFDEERAAYGTAIVREANDWRTRALLSDRLRAAGDPAAPRPIASTLGGMRAEQQRWSWDNLSPPPTSELDIGAADIGYIKGFETTEVEPLTNGGEITYRWTTSHAYVRLAPPGGGDRLKLLVRWHSLAWPGKPNMDAEVRIAVDGREVGSLTARPGWETAEMDLPDVGTRASVVIELRVPTEKPPGAETRYLGVAIDWLRLEPTR